MIPFQQMQQDHAQRVLHLIVLSAPDVIELLGNVERIRLDDLAGAQQRGLLDCPGIKVLVVARRPGRTGSIVHGAPPAPGSARYSAKQAMPEPSGTSR